MTIWLIIFGMAVVTYGARLIPLTVLNEEALPTWARRGLTYVPIAVLSAIIGPAFIPHEQWGQFTFDARLLAGLVAIWVAYRTRNILVTIGVGILTLIILNALF